MDQHKEQMGKFLETLSSSKTSCVVPDKKYAEIVNVIKDPFGYKNRLFRCKVKVKGYQIMDLPGLGVKDASVIPNKESSKGETSLGFLRVIPESKVYDVMQQETIFLPIFLIIRFQISLQNQQEGHHKSWIKQLITSCCQLRRIRNMMLTFLVSFNKLNIG